jgi:tetratricopeptide (TPR) repeat protein
MDYFLLAMQGFSSFEDALASPDNDSMLKKIDVSITALRKAALTKDGRNDARIPYVLGKAYYYKGGDWADQAVTELERAERMDFHAADIDEYLGLAKAQIRDYKGSVEAFADALTADGSNANASVVKSGEDLLLLSIARSYHGMGDEQQAHAYLQRCIDVTKDYNARVEAQFLLAEILKKNGDAKQAEDLYLAMLNNGGESAKARYELGEIYADQGDSTRARAEWRKALKADPAYEPAREKLAL